MVTQDEIEWVLKMAEDELVHLERDAKLDDECMGDYIYSEDVFERVQEYLTNEGRINDYTG